METNLPEVIAVNGTTYRRESTDELLAPGAYGPALDLILAINAIVDRTGCEHKHAAWAVLVVNARRCGHPELAFPES